MSDRRGLGCATCGGIPGPRSLFAAVVELRFTDEEAWQREMEAPSLVQKFIDEWTWGPLHALVDAAGGPAAIDELIAEHEWRQLRREVSQPSPELAEIRRRRVADVLREIASAPRVIHALDSPIGERLPAALDSTNVEPPTNEAQARELAPRLDEPAPRAEVPRAA